MEGTDLEHWFPADFNKQNKEEEKKPKNLKLSVKWL